MPRWHECPPKHQFDRAVHRRLLVQRWQARLAQLRVELEHRRQEATLMQVPEKYCEDNTMCKP